MAGCRNLPCKCGETHPDKFGWHRYVMGSGGVGRRRDARCLSCRRTARKARYHANPAADAAMGARWRSRNAARITAYNAARQQRAEVRAMKAMSQRARKSRMKAGIEGPEDPRILAVYRQAKALETKLRACVACDDDLQLQVHVDHIVPLSRGGKHVFENLQILCGRENLEKGARI